MFNASDLIIPTRHDEAPGLEIENEDEEDIENPGPRSSLPEGGLQHPPSIFDRHNSRLWDYVIDAQDSCRSAPANYKKVCQAIQEKFGYQPKPWQAAVIMDIVYGKKDVMVSAGTGAGKSLIYQAVPLMNSGAIVLTITPTIALIEDQERELKQRGVSALALTAAAVKADPNIWKRLEQEDYSVIFAFSEIVLAPQSHFWKHTIGRKGNEFCRRLACIAVDEAHLIWGWREF